MATTKKFAQMSTKKLNALLETASEEDAVAIKAILESRNAQQAEAGAGEGTELSEEEKQAIEAAEKASAPEGGEPANEEKKKGGRKASPKLSEDELLEVTPQNLRIRKRLLDHAARMRELSKKKTQE